MSGKCGPSPERQSEQKEDESSRIIWLLKMIFSNSERKSIHPSLAVCDSMNPIQLAKLVGVKPQKMLEALKTLPLIDANISEDTQIDFHVLEALLFPESKEPKKNTEERGGGRTKKYAEIMEFVKKNPEGVTAERIASACDLGIQQAITLIGNLRRRNPRLVQEFVESKSRRGRRDRIFKWRGSPEE